MQIKHFLDSLTITLALPSITTGLRIIDIGTGAGFPGLPLKIILPEIKLTLLEATGKKTAFLSNVVSKLGLEDIEILSGRAEELAHKPVYRESFDIALARGVADLATLAELTLPFCAITGSLIAQKTEPFDVELGRADKAIKAMGGELRKIIGIHLNDYPEGRILMIIDKISHTPPEYPRRPGMPAKKPIK